MINSEARYILRIVQLLRNYIQLVGSVNSVCFAFRAVGFVRCADA
jgi:hypothetical protein